MKKLKRLVFGGIENKTHALVLISMLLVATVYSVSMVAQDNVLSHLSQETNKRQLATMTGTTTEALDSVIVQNMDRITEMEAKLTDELFRDRMIGVQMVGDYATKLLENPGDVARVAWHRPDASHDGELFVKALFAPRIGTRNGRRSTGRSRQHDGPDAFPVRLLWNGQYLVYAARRRYTDG